MVKKFRTPQEEEVGRNIERIFNSCSDPMEIELGNFPEYVRRQYLKRFLAPYELDNPLWPGETLALLESVGIRQLKLQRFEWDPYIAYAVLE